MTVLMLLGGAVVSGLLAYLSFALLFPEKLS